MPLKCLSILLLTLFSSTGFTQTQFFGIPLSSSNKKGCPEFTNNEDTNGNLNDRYKSAQKIKNYCQRAEILFSLSEKILNSKKFKGSPFHEMVARDLILTLVAAKDSVSTINEANKYLDLYANGKYGAHIHYQLLVAQNSRILDAKRSQKDTLIALGLEPEQKHFDIVVVTTTTPSGMTLELERQQVNNPHFDLYKYRRSFQSFFDTYGLNSSYAKKLLSFYDKAALRIQEKELEVGLYYYKRKAYMAAISRFRNVTDAGPVFMNTIKSENFNVWDEAAFYTALSFIELAKSLLGQKPVTFHSNQYRQSLESLLWFLPEHSYKITDKQIAYWLKLDPSEYNPEKNPDQPNRLDLARQSLKNAGLIVKEMKTARKTSKMSQKLISETRKKISTSLKTLIPDAERLLNL
ncbi:MAG: outer membrane protein assembly factor BamD [Bdellovibrionales bacterium]|nr:outer membrane protein assembly factor BamD [Bdellovibrionales bacterium]